MDAIRRGCEADIDDLLRAKPGLSLETCPKGMTMLHHAVAFSKWQLGLKFLGVGVDVNAQQPGAATAGHGDTALHLFMSQYNPGEDGYKFASALVERHMARLDLPGHQGKTVAGLHFAQCKSWTASFPSLRSSYAAYKRLMDDRCGVAALEASVRAMAGSAVSLVASSGARP